MSVAPVALVDNGYKNYRDFVTVLQSINRGILLLVKNELEAKKAYNVNNVQAIMLHGIGDGDMSMGELTACGCYLGSNVSYNVKKMLEAGYLKYEVSRTDRRMRFVRLTPEGRKIRELVELVHRGAYRALPSPALSPERMAAVVAVARSFDRFLMLRADRVRGS